MGDAGHLLAAELELLAARAGGGRPGALAWLAGLRQLAAQTEAGGRGMADELLERPELLSRAAFTVRLAGG